MDAESLAESVSAWRHDLNDDGSITLWFVGHQEGDEVKGISKCDSMYSTYSYGYLQNFQRSAAKAGEVIEYQGSKYEVLSNWYRQGSAAVPTKHRLTLRELD